MALPANYPIESVENAARVLLMLRYQDSLRIATVSADLGIARSSAHRMLTTLQAHGLLRQDPVTKAFRAGPELVELGMAVIGATDIRSAARPFLSELASASGETVHLLVLEGTDVLFLDGVEGAGVIRAALRIGQRAPAHAAGAGKALLARLSKEDLRSRYPRPKLSGGTGKAISSRRELEQELEIICDRGFATNLGESENGLHAIGATVTDRSGATRCALSLSGPSERLTPERLTELSSMLLKTVHLLGQQLS